MPDSKQLESALQQINDLKAAAELAAVMQAAIVESSDDAIISTDLTGILVSWNKGAEKIFGYTAAEIAGTSILRLLPEDRAEEENFILRQIKAGRNIAHFETIRQTKEGRMLDISVTASPIKDARGTIIGVSKIARDITARKESEKVLLESNRRFNEMLANVKLIALTLDREGTITFCNDFLLHLTGWKKEEVMGCNWFESFLPESGEAIRKLFLDAINSGTIPLHHQNPIKTRSGELRMIAWNNTTLRDLDGRIIGTASIGEDVTEWEQAEEARRMSEERYRALFDYAPEGILIIDPENKALDANSAMCSMLGFSRTEIIGLRTVDIVPEMENPQIANAAKLLTSSSEYRRECVLRRKDGSTFEGEVNLTTMPGGNRLAMIRNIAERKRAEEVLHKLTLREAGRKKASIIWDLLVISLIGALSLTFLYYTDLLQKPFESFVERFPGPEHLDEVFGTLLTVLFCFCVFSYRRWREAKHRFDEHAIIEDALRILHGELEKRIAGRTVELTKANESLRLEISERHRLEAERQKLEEQFRQAQKMEGIGRLAGGVAHDFNNILAVIQMQSELLKMSGNLNLEQAEYANEIITTVQRAATLTRQLLLFSRRQVFQPRDLDLSESILNTAKMLKRILGENIHIDLKLAPEPMFTHADPGMLDQVLMNLAVNARDAMPNGGHLIIETAAAEFDEVSAGRSTQTRPGSFVTLSVSDSGIGIPKENLAMIFEPFFTTKDVGKGTGLGLATVFGIVQQHQGWVNVYSEPGHGATFRIYLPRQMENRSRNVATAGPIAFHRGHETILLVEDDPTLRLSIRKSLAQLGYRILEAAAGAQALEVWKQNQQEIVLLLTDLIMPDRMTGKDLAERLLQQNPKLKVIYMSGYSADLLGKDFPQLKDVNFLSKPFQAHQLAQIVRKSLDSKNEAGPVSA